MKRVLLLIVLAVALAAQEVPDSKGRDFWFCFMPNYHNDGMNSSNARQRDSLYIYIAADEPTNVRLEFTPYDGRPPQVINARIDNPAQMLTIPLSYAGVELIGVNMGAGDVSMPWERHTQRPVRYTFHLVSDHDVTVYALNRAETTSDAFLVLPTDALGRDYYVMSYNTDVYPNGDNTPSQFAVVATEDSTVVEFVRVTSPTTDGPISRILLNRGEAYLVQSRTTSEQYDLTGTRIKSNRPIAVFSGHQRARVPLSTREYMASRDCLIEQIPPSATWGRSAFLVPYMNPDDGSDPEGGQGDRYRILAARDSTVIYIDSIPIVTLNAGQYYEGPLSSAHTVHANRPILVAQFRETSTPRPGSILLVGDPFMMIMPPAEQFMSGYRFICPLSYQRSVNEPRGRIEEVYLYHYVTIVVHDTAKASLVLDGRPVTTTFWPIPKSKYVYTQVRLEAGVHTVSANAPIGISVYGYGYADSYGYVGGMSFRRYDFEPPKISSLPQCPPYRLVVYDTLPSDSRVDVVRIIEDSTENVVWEIVRQTMLPQDSVEVRIALRDPYSDGVITIVAQDAEQFITRARVPIPGMTLRVVDSDGTTNRFPRVYSFVSATQRNSCFRVPITNVGNYPQTILRAWCRIGDVVAQIQPPLTVVPRDTAEFQVCYRTTRPATIADTLWLETPCGQYAAAIFHVEFIYDTLPPRILRNRQPCPSVDIITAQEHGYSQTGIAGVTVLDSFNIVLTVASSPENIALAEEQTIRVAQRDWRLDGWYTIEVADSVGNRSLVEGVFLGHTVMIANRDSLDARQSFVGRSNQFLCDTIELYNFGRFPKTFERLVSRGVEMAVPPAFVPLIVGPGERVRVPVCALMPFYSAGTANIYRDTLELLVGCYRRALPVEVHVLATAYAAESSCGVLVSSGGDTTTVRLEQQGSSVRADLGVAADWQGALYSMAGQCMMNFRQQGTVLSFDLGAVPAGAYWLVVHSTVGLVRVPILWTGQ